MATGQEFSPLEALASLLGVSVMTATVRSILSNQFTWGSWLRKVILSFFVGGMAGLVLHDQTAIGPGMQGFIISFCAFTADMLLMLSLEIVEKLQKNPAIIIDYILRRNPRPPIEDEGSDVEK